jgi:hypothetical protein
MFASASRRGKTARRSRRARARALVLRSTHAFAMMGFDRASKRIRRVACAREGLVACVAGRSIARVAVEPRREVRSSRATGASSIERCEPTGRRHTDARRWRRRRARRRRARRRRARRR